MSNLRDGKYLIVLATPSAPPPFPVGANDIEGPTRPVVAGGEINAWTVRPVEVDSGTYTLTLEEGGTKWLSQGAGDNVVVGIMPLPGIWRIQKQNDDTYSIEVPSPIWPTRAWTLADTKPGTKVTLGIYELPRPGQLWKFIRIFED